MYYISVLPRADFFCEADPGIKPVLLHRKFKPQTDKVTFSRTKKFVSGRYEGSLQQWRHTSYKNAVAPNGHTNLHMSIQLKMGRIMRDITNVQQQQPSQINYYYIRNKFYKKYLLTSLGCDQKGSVGVYTKCHHLNVNYVDNENS